MNYTPATNISHYKATNFLSARVVEVADKGVTVQQVDLGMVAKAN